MNVNDKLYCLLRAAGSRGENKRGDWFDTSRLGGDCSAG